MIKQSEVYVPLFDRLCDTAPSASKDSITLDFTALKQSISKEIDNLFNSRSPMDVGAFKAKISKYYGLDVPSLPHYFGVYDVGDPESSIRNRTFERILRDAIIAFEPRLGKPDVVIQGFDVLTGTLSVKISGVLTLGDRVRHMSFSKAYRPHG